MKLTLSRKTFANALSISLHFTTSKAQLPILGNVLLEAKDNKLNISATNLEMSAYLPVAAKVVKDGSITIPAKVLFEVVSNLNSESVDIEVDKESVVVKNSSFSSQILGMNASDFPTVPNGVGKDAFALDTAVLSNSLPKVLYCVSQDETRPTLTGTLFVFGKGVLSIVATDGFRLSKNDISLKNIEKEFKVILPKGILSEIERTAKEEKISFEYDKENKQIIFQIGDMVLSSRVIEGDFPDYEKIIPTSSGLKISTDKNDLMQGVKLASVFARDSSNVVRFVINENSMKLTAESSQSGSQESMVDVKVESSGKEVFGDKGEFVIAFNCRYIEEFINSVDGDNLEIKFNDVNSPGVFLDINDKNLLHLIMPVRI